MRREKKQFMNKNGTKFSDQELYKMATETAYNMKGKKIGETLVNESTKKTYTVIDIQHDNVTGFDAMAVKDSSGNIMIVYGGTNSKDGPQDIVPDAATGISYLPNGNKIGQEQFKQAKEFRDRVKNANPESDITLTGHSLGGGLSNSVALQTGDKAVNFNPAPLPYDLSTIFGNGAQRSDIINYQTHGDPLGMALQIFGGYLPGQIKQFDISASNPLDNHNMKGVHFDANGNLIDEHGRIVCDFGNSNINSGNSFFDELLRAVKMEGSGIVACIGGVLAMAGGVLLIVIPFTFIDGIKLFGSGVLAVISGVFITVGGILRSIISGIGFVLDLGRKVINFVYKKVTEAIHFVVNGAIAIAKKIVTGIKKTFQIIKDTAISIAQTTQKIGTKIITAVYDEIQKFGKMIQQAGEFISQQIQAAYQSFINIKDQVFEMVYSFIKNSIQMLFDAWEVIELLGSMAAQMMKDILVLNWMKLEGHILQKITEFQTIAKNDFIHTTRGFDHELAEEIATKLQSMSYSIRLFSERIHMTKEKFHEMENDISRQVKDLGGRICLSY